MTTLNPPAKRRITIVEVLVVATLLAVLLAIAVPVLLNKGDDPAMARDLRDAQRAVRLYFADTGAYPTLEPPSNPDKPPVNVWIVGALPNAASEPRYAGIDFNAQAVKKGTEERVRFSPDYLKDRPRHAGEFGADGTRRWRIDSQGVVSVEMDERSY